MTMDAFITLISTLAIIGYWILVVTLSIRVLIKRRPFTYVIAWLFIIQNLPVLGVLLYLLIGENHLGTKRAKHAAKITPMIKRSFVELQEHKQIFSKDVSPTAEHLFELCRHKQHIPGVKGNQLLLISNTEQILKHIITDINAAKTSIDMIFYIWHAQGKVIDVINALIAAKSRGVKCRIILDSAGSRGFFKTAHYQIMKIAGIEIVEALKVNILRFFLRRMDLRQHRKMVLIDNHVAYTGSMNMVDPRYFKQDVGVGEWVDIMLRIDGPITSLMRLIYTFDWELETGDRVYPPAPVAPQFPLDEGHILHVIASGPGFDPEMIHQSLLTAVYSAKESLIMTTPYFVPSDDLLNAICIVAQRGVDVRIILPTKNDSIMVKWASRAFFSELLESGVKLYKYRGGLLHTKSVLVDNQLSLIGTVNLDMRSLWLNFEITAVIDDAEFGHSLYKLQTEYIQDSGQLYLSEWRKRPLWQSVIERLFYFFSPLL